MGIGDSTIYCRAVVFDTIELYNGAAIRRGVNIIGDNGLDAAIDRTAYLQMRVPFLERRPGSEI
jgi:hypothetical protein